MRKLFGVQYITASEPASIEQFLQIHWSHSLALPSRFFPLSIFSMVVFKFSNFSKWEEKCPCDHFLKSNG